jgi:hypothetical protein
MIDETRADEIAQQLDEGIDDFFALNTKDKIVVIKKYLDRQIGTEPRAEIKKIDIPGVPFDISGNMLEKASDMTLDAVATLIVNKWFSGAPA